jgi:hypothetical protein
MPATIPGGYVLLSRKLIESSIMKKPSLFLKVWVWILLKAYHSKRNGLERGEFKTSIPEIQFAMAYSKGFVEIKPTYKEIRDILDWLRDPCAQSCERIEQGHNEGHTDSSMIVTMKVTHGLTVKVCNYSIYQNPKNYEGHKEGHTKERPEGHDEGIEQGQIETLEPLSAKNNQGAEECIYKNDAIYTVFEHWNSKGIIVHRKLTDPIKGAINFFNRDMMD